MIICGTHSPKNVEEILTKIKGARENKIPTLGICMGMQLMAIEYARDIAGIEDATSEEIGKGTFIVKKLPDLRVGIRPVNITMPNGDNYSGNESHWHNYHVVFPFKDIDSGGSYNIVQSHNFNESFKEMITEAFFIPGHFYLGVQFHPEYQSSKQKPHPILVEFLNYAREYTRNMAMQMESNTGKFRRITSRNMGNN